MLQNKDLNSNKSKLHKSISSIVEQCFKDEIIKEEVTIKIDGKTLFLDIFLPRLKIAIECDGIQHDKFNTMFHSDIYAFQKQKANDKLKDMYCSLKGIILVRIKHNEKINQEILMGKISNAIKNNDIMEKDYE